MINYSKLGFILNWTGRLCIFVIIVMVVSIVDGTATEKQPNKGDEPLAERSLEADLVWPEYDGSDYEIFVSSFRDNSWLPRIQVTNNADVDIVPTVVRDNHGVLWIVWSKVTDDGTALYFSMFDGKNWSSQKKIETGFSRNLSAGMAVDHENQIWLVWASFDGVDDDIFFSRWNGADWDAPMRVNTDDSTPDIKPVIDIGPDGFPLVQWSSFEEGTYKQVYSRWDGEAWEKEEEVLTAAAEETPSAPEDAAIADHGIAPGPDNNASAPAGAEEYFLPPEGASAEIDNSLTTPEEKATPEVTAGSDASSPATPVSKSISEPDLSRIQIKKADGRNQFLSLPLFLFDPEKAGIYIVGSDGEKLTRPLRTLFPKEKTP